VCVTCKRMRPLAATAPKYDSWDSLPDGDIPNGDISTMGHSAVRRTIHQRCACHRFAISDRYGRSQRPARRDTSAQHQQNISMMHIERERLCAVLRRTARGPAGLWPSRRTACDFIVAMRTITRSGQLVAALARLPPPARRSRCGACWHCCSSSRGGCRARSSFRETVGRPQAPAEGRDTSSHFNSGLCTPKSVRFCSCN
jgi:hypothetical protein